MEMLGHKNLGTTHHGTAVSWSCCPAGGQNGRWKEAVLENVPYFRTCIGQPTAASCVVASKFTWHAPAALYLVHFRVGITHHGHWCPS